MVRKNPCRTESENAFSKDNALALSLPNTNQKERNSTLRHESPLLFPYIPDDLQKWWGRKNHCRVETQGRVSGQDARERYSHAGSVSVPARSARRRNEGTRGSVQ